MNPGRSLPCPAADLVPHRKPMLLVDTVLQIGDDEAPDSYSIVEADAPVDSIFFSNGQVLNEYLIELLAQSIAAVDGHKTRPNGPEPYTPAMGFLAGIDEFICHHRPTPGERLRIRLRKNFTFGSFFIFDGTIHGRDRLLASGRIKIFKEESP